MGPEVAAGDRHLPLCRICAYLVRGSERANPVSVPNHIRARLRAYLKGSGDNGRTDSGSRSMPADEVFRATAADGLERLDDASIMTLIRLRAELADRARPKACAALWSGDNVDLVAAIESLPDDQQQQWAELFDRAAAATVNHTPIRPAPSAEQYQEAFNRTMAGLGPSEFEEVASTVTNPDHQTARDQCIAARLFYGRLKQMSNADALIVTRSRLYK